MDEDALNALRTKAAAWRKHLFPEDDGGGGTGVSPDDLRPIFRGSPYASHLADADGQDIEDALRKQDM